MKKFKEFINESLDITNSKVTIEELMNKLYPHPNNDWRQDHRSIDEKQIKKIIDWWNSNRSRFEIYYFPFTCEEPIGGVIADNNVLYLNEKIRMPEYMKLFVLIHESKHSDQYLDGSFEDGYFQTVVNDNKEKFIEYYKKSETEANDYAMNAMKEIGFEIERWEENFIRGNEVASEEVFEMMKKDIEKYKPKTFFELTKAQIL